MDVHLKVTHDLSHSIFFRDVTSNLALLKLAYVHFSRFTEEIQRRGSQTVQARTYSRGVTRQKRPLNIISAAETWQNCSPCSGRNVICPTNPIFPCVPERVFVHHQAAVVLSARKEREIVERKRRRGCKSFS